MRGSLEEMFLMHSLHKRKDAWIKQLGEKGERAFLEVRKGGEISQITTRSSAFTNRPTVQCHQRHLASVVLQDRLFAHLSTTARCDQKAGEVMADAIPEIRVH